MNNSHEMNFCGGGIMGSTSLLGSSISRKPAHVLPDQFPAGLRVLVVDDDPTCLKILEKMLRTCRYEATKCNRAKIALDMLRKNKNGFDVVISDVHMPDMDGFKLLEHIGLEMDLPVIMMSADDSSNVVMKGVTHGACDYLIKPVRIEALKNIWQHFVRKKKNEFKDIEQSGSLDDGDRQHKQDESEYSSPENEGNWKSAKRKGDEEESEDNTDTATLKKPRVVWSVELHQQFVAAVNQLGIDRAVPKKILELMNFHGLTRENVASHLQKYRLYLRRLSGVSQHHSGLNNAFMGPQDSAFAVMSSLGGIDYQALAVTAQLPAQTLAAFQAGVGSSGVKPGITMPFIDQRNLFSFESSKRRYGGQQLSSSSRQMNLLHGIPATMEPKQLASLHQSAAQPMRAVNMQMGGAHGGRSDSVLMQMVQSQLRGHLLNESVDSQASRMQSSSGQTLPSNGASVGILPRIDIAENPTSGLSYNPVTHSSSVVDFSVNNILVDLPGNGFPLESTPGTTSLTSNGGLVPGELKMSDIRESNGGFAPSYDIFDYRQQNRSQDYQSQNSSPMSSYGTSHSQPTTLTIQNNVNVSPSVLVHQAFSSGHQKNEQSGNALIGKTKVFSAGPNHRQQGIPCNTNQNLNSFDNSSRLATEERIQDIGTGTNLFQEQYGQDDLMSAILKQQQDFTAGECYLDGYTLDKFHVNEVFTSQ